MLEASHMPEASIHGSLLARPGVSLRENERFPPQHCLGSGGSRLNFGAYAAAHHQEWDNKKIAGANFCTDRQTM